jgi:phosphoserine phosphatase
MAKKLTRMAIAYDFDGTLAPGNMQEHSFIPNLNMTKEEFWKEVKAYAKEQDMDEILAYMRLMLHKAGYAHLRVTKDSFRKHGRNIQFFPGVNDWFARINAYGRDREVRIDHYIISSGLREMIEGTSIYKEFEYVFASGFAYDPNDVAIWPALAVNYTNKTQHLFRINRGIKNAYDNATINKVQLEEECYIPLENMIYVGDGETDVPCMSLLRSQGGTAVAVYNPQKRKTKQVAQDLIEHGRADFSAPADYSEGQMLEQIVRAVIDRTAAAARINHLKRGRSVRKVGEMSPAPASAPLEPCAETPDSPPAAPAKSES